VSKRQRQARSILILALGMLTASAATPEPAFALPPTTQVAADGVFLDQILVVQPPTALPHLRVADAPRVGETTTLTRDQVRQWLSGHAPEFVSTNWTAQPSIRITRRTRSLDEIELRELLCSTLQKETVKDKGELELRLTRNWTSLMVPEEPVSLRIVDVPATGPSANFIVRFELWSGEERLGNWQLTASARIWREVPVAVTPLRRGQLLSGADVNLERRDVLTLRGAPGIFSANEGLLELVENIPAGQPVLARSVRPRPVVQRGQMVDAIVDDGPLSISLKVEMLQEGLPGQLVRVRNPRTRRELMGKVLNEQTIVLSN
jgi:flagella basal body P-ring formation protein FlgA